MLICTELTNQYSSSQILLLSSFLYLWISNCYKHSDQPVKKTNQSLTAEATKHKLYLQTWVQVPYPEKSYLSLNNIRYIST